MLETRGSMRHFGTPEDESAIAEDLEQQDNSGNASNS